MNVKEFLSQAHHIDRKISHQLDQLASIREFTTKALKTCIIPTDLQKNTVNSKKFTVNS